MMMMMMMIRKSNTLVSKIMTVFKIFLMVSRSCTFCWWKIKLAGFKNFYSILLSRIISAPTGTGSRGWVFIFLPPPPPTHLTFLPPPPPFIHASSHTPLTRAQPRTFIQPVKRHSLPSSFVQIHVGLRFTKGLIGFFKSFWSKINSKFRPVPMSSQSRQVQVGSGSGFLEPCYQNLRAESE